LRVTALRVEGVGIQAGYLSVTVVTPMRHGVLAAGVKRVTRNAERETH
jgi:hypothetical protein